MKYSLDTNIFIYGLYKQDFDETVNTFFQDTSNYSFTTLALRDEIVQSLTLVNFFLENVKRGLGKEKDLNKLMNDVLSGLKGVNFFPRFGNIVEHIRSFKDRSMTEFISALKKIHSISNKSLARLDNVKIFQLIGPKDIQEQEKKLKELRNFIDSKKDIRHLVLCYFYAKEYKEEAFFVSEDKKDILNNKENIEKICELLKITNHADWKAVYPRLIS